jgi:hypothetical protein
MSELEPIIITDKTILSYYKENTNIDIIAINHIFIEILKTLSSNLSNTINTTINSKILSIVTDIDKNIHQTKTDILLKFFETKREYIEDLKTILLNNNTNNNEKILNNIEKNNELLLSKIFTTINDIIPKTQQNTYLQIESCVKTFSSDLVKDIKKIIDIIDKTNRENNVVKELTNNIDNHFNQMFSTIQQPIFNYIQSSESRTKSGIDQIKENVFLQGKLQETLKNEINEFLNKYKNSSQFKGNVAEIELHHLLMSIMPSDEIIRVSSDTATCDLKVNRKDTTKPNILFESKNYTNRSVSTNEVKKFERDIQQQKIHGIFISQETPITYKDNFQIDIINGLIHIYLPNVNYDCEKIKIAIDIIDHLSFKLEGLNTENDILSISKEEIDDIAEEYKIFGIKKIQIIETIKNLNKQLIEQLEDIQLPNIKKVLTRLGNIENDNFFKCTLCNNWLGKNKASLAAHIRNCKFNNKNKNLIENIENNENNENIIEINDDVVDEIQNNNTIKKPSKKYHKKKY